MVKINGNKIIIEIDCNNGDPYELLNSIRRETVLMCTYAIVNTKADDLGKLVKGKSKIDLLINSMLNLNNGSKSINQSKSGNEPVISAGDKSNKREFPFKFYLNSCLMMLYESS